LKFFIFYIFLINQTGIGYDTGQHGKIFNGVRAKLLDYTLF